MENRCRKGIVVETFKNPRLLLALLLTVAGLTAAGGCTRNFFRRWADREVDNVLVEKDRYAKWKIEQYHVYPDPRARFADPTNPDHPPMPPDDEAAYKLSPHPQRPGHAGVGDVQGSAWLEIIKTWDGQNREERDRSKQPEPPPTKDGVQQALYQEPPPANPPAPAADAQEPEPKEYLAPSLAEQKGYLLTVDQCVELGLINSREYQSAREDLYLACLPVTQDRFSFAWLFSATETAIRQWAGSLSQVGPQQNWTLQSGAGVTKLFSTGALLTFSFANTTVFNFINHATTSQSFINLDFAQPLLQGGGWAVTLEPLTQAERSLVYTIRAYARFRGVFYASIYLGSTLPSSLPSIASPLGVSGTVVISTLAALGIASTDVSGVFRGFMPTLYREVDMHVDQKYVRDLEKALQLFIGYEEGGQVGPLQVDQVRSTLLNAQNTVLGDIQFVTNALDQFKLQLGIPLDIPLILDDREARPITRQHNRYYEILEQADTAIKLVEAQETLPPEKMRAFLFKLFTTDPLVRGMPFKDKLPADWAALARRSDKQLKDRLLFLTRERRRLLDLKTDIEMKGQPFPAREARRLTETDFEADLSLLEEVLRRFESQPWEKLPPNSPQRRLERNNLFRTVARAAEFILVWPRNERLAHVFELWPSLPPVPLGDLDLLTADAEEAQAAAVQTALRNRWDYMNGQAQLVDAWRQIRVTANALMGVATVSYLLSSQTPPNSLHALAFNPQTTNQELILNTQLPLVRMSQRNAYRTALINFQRARRGLQSLEDNIASQLRFDVRQLHLFAENYKIQQKVLASLYSQVENSLEQIAAPTDPTALTVSGTQGQANAAALTQQYLGALQSLNGAQTRIYDIWLSYLTTRMQLYLDLELLPLNSRGVWTDEFATSDLSRPAAGGAGLGQPDSGGQRADQLPAPRLLPPAAAAPVE
jgi:hypothetical protein